MYVCVCVYLYVRVCACVQVANAEPRMCVKGALNAAQFVQLCAQVGRPEYTTLTLTLTLTLTPPLTLTLTIAPLAPDSVTFRPQCRRDRR